MEMKKCNKCDIEKDLELFNKDKSSKDGHRSNCKECNKNDRLKNKEKSKDYRLKNKEKIREYGKNRKFEPERKREYYLLNKEEILLNRKEYYKENRDQKLEYQKKYQKNNKDKRNIQLSERRKTDPLYRLITNIRNLINNSFYEMGYSKTSRTQEILGCSFEEFKSYLESKFEPWMTWENRGLYNGELDFGWDIDHIIPLVSAESVEELVRLNHFVNLQPLCSKVNRDIKKNKIEDAII
jgi:hypothetical protein